MYLLLLVFLTFIQLCYLIIDILSLMQYKSFFFNVISLGSAYDMVHFVTEEIQ